LVVPGVSPASSKVGVGDPFPVWTLAELGGTEHQLGGGGEVQLLYFLGSGCAICVDICKRIDADFAQRYPRHELGIYAVDSLDGTDEELTRLANEAAVRFPFLLKGSPLTAECGISWHAIVVIDDRGVVRHLSEGANSAIYDGDTLHDLVEQLLGRAAETQQHTWGAIKQLYDGR
jgi:hypothetical protein